VSLQQLLEAFLLYPNILLLLLLLLAVTACHALALLRP
jgi:hypothetical protein